MLSLNTLYLLFTLTLTWYETTCLSIGWFVTCRFVVVSFNSYIENQSSKYITMYWKNFTYHYSFLVYHFLLGLKHLSSGNNLILSSSWMGFKWQSFRVIFTALLVTVVPWSLVPFGIFPRKTSWVIVLATARFFFQ